MSSKVESYTFFTNISSFKAFDEQNLVCQVLLLKLLCCLNKVLELSGERNTESLLISM